MRAHSMHLLRRHLRLHPCLDLHLLLLLALLHHRHLCRVWLLLRRHHLLELRLCRNLRLEGWVPCLEILEEAER